MKKLIYILLLTIGFLQMSCFNDLNTLPIDPSIKSADIVYGTPDSYIQGLAKVYAGLAVSGQEGPSGKPDISGIDEGFGQYLRGYWYHQELPTDEAIIGWNDQTIADFHDQDWTPSDGFVYAFFSRIFYQVSIANEYLRQTSDAKLAERNTPAELLNTIKSYRAEARFLRALSYWHALDLFRNVPFGTEADPVGTYVAKQTNAQELFAYLEKELLEIQNDLITSNGGVQATYGRANKAAAWTLLSKLYLNAEVYIGQNKYAQAAEFAEKVINANTHQLDPIYQNVFLADNHLSKEIIFPINYDGLATKTWGGTTFVIRAGIGGSYNPVLSGVESGWSGLRTTKEFIEKFPKDLTGIVSPFNPGKNYPKIYIPGSYQVMPFDGSDTKNALSSSKSNKIYEGYRYFPTDNSEFVVLRNPSSTLSGKLGDNGGDGTLETGGANIKVASKGFYYISVDLNNNTYKIEKQDWSVLGSATTVGWENDINLKWNEDLGYLTANVELTEGEIKFRANKAWNINLGDTGKDGILDNNGDNIKITKSGAYEIRVDLRKPDYSYELRLTSFDKRGIFHTAGQQIEIDNVSDFTNGYAVVKFKNITSTGARGKDSQHPDTDFPVFRLADVYLMAAEAILRSGGNTDKALEYVNKVRTRAFTGSAGNIAKAELTLPFILDERGRELYWEAHRRTDLVRYGQFTDGTYNWQWKGGVKEGRKVEDFRNIFPIPTNELGANLNLKQNPGYQ
jgi:hypothetical protein